MYCKFYQSATYPGVQEYVIDEDTPPVEATPSGGGTPRPAMSEAEVASERERENNKLSNTIHESPFVHHHVHTAHATHLLTLKKSSPQLFSHLKMKPRDFFLLAGQNLTNLLRITLELLIQTTQMRALPSTEVFSSWLLYTLRPSICPFQKLPFSVS